MNIYEKLSNAREEIAQKQIKKTGRNDFSKYNYFDLPDILPIIRDVEKKQKLISTIKFYEKKAILELNNLEDVEEFPISFEVPFELADIKGAQPVQNLGAAITYIRRYLYILAYEIVENDIVDQQGKNDKTSNETAEEMPLEKAMKFRFGKGKYAGVTFEKMPSEGLRWAAENANDAYKKAAKIVLKERERLQAQEVEEPPEWDNVDIDGDEQWY